MVFQSWYEVASEALGGLLQGFINFIPNLVGALIVFFIGWLLAIAIGRLVTEILVRLKFNRLFERGNWKEALSKSGLKADVAGFIGAIFKWALVITSLYMAASILELKGVKEVLESVLGYIPNVIIASFIFVVAVIVADILEKVVRAAVEGMKVDYAHLVGVIVKWSIWTFAIIIILGQLQVAPEFMSTLFKGFVGMMALAMGLAFGLGGKDTVAEALNALKRKLSGR